MFVWFDASVGDGMFKHVRGKYNRPTAARGPETVTEAVTEAGESGTSGRRGKTQTIYSRNMSLKFY